jgi:nucleotide-binding universal stress UspA family protein
VHLLLGIDHSPGSAAAVEAVAARSWPPQTHVTVAMALDLQTSGALAMALGVSGFEGGREITRRHWVTEPIARVQRELEQAGLQVSSVVEKANPRAFLVGEARDRAIECIFVGARGLSHLERFLIGSVSSSVAARAECSVEVVRQAGS